MIPGEPLWVPRRMLRLPGGNYLNPAHITARRMCRITLWAATMWTIVQWVTIGL